MKKNLIISLLTLSLLIMNFSLSSGSVNTVTQETADSLNTYDRSTWVWDSYQLISDSSSLYSRTPSMLVDEEGNVFVVWDDETDMLG